MTPGFQRSRKDQARRRDESAIQAVAPQPVELNRFGSPLRELGADRAAYADEISRVVVGSTRPIFKDWPVSRSGKSITPLMAASRQ